MSLENKYIRLQAKLSPSTDYSRGTIYAFQKYCKACGQGMIKPAMWDRRTLRALFKKGYHSEGCLGKGERNEADILKAKPSPPSLIGKEYLMEELAEVRLEMERADKRLKPMARLVARVDRKFKLLSEKLRFLEIETGERWYESKYFYWMGRS